MQTASMTPSASAQRQTALPPDNVYARVWLDEPARRRTPNRSGDGCRIAQRQRRPAASRPMPYTTRSSSRECGQTPPQLPVVPDDPTGAHTRPDHGPGRQYAWQPKNNGATHEGTPFGDPRTRGGGLASADVVTSNVTRRCLRTMLGDAVLPRPTPAPPHHSPYSTPTQADPHPH